MTRPPLELLRGALEKLLTCYSVEKAFGDDMCPDCRENPEHMHGPGDGEGCPVPIIQAALGALGALENGPVEPAQALKDLGGVRVMVPMLHDTTTGERFIALDVAELAHNVTQALRAQAEAVLRVEQAARELMERSEQPEHTCNWSYGRGAREALKDIHGVLAQADADAGGEAQ